MVTTATVTPGIDVLTDDVDIPGLGHLPINAYVLHGDAPVLVDTGSIAQADEFDAALRSVIDVADLRWIWLTHTDFDHIGLLHRLLAENPDLRVITTFFGVGIMGLFDPLPDGPRQLREPGRDDHARRPHAHRGEARPRSTTRSPSASTTTAPTRSSAPTASVRCSRRPGRPGRRPLGRGAAPRSGHVGDDRLVVDAQGRSRGHRRRPRPHARHRAVVRAERAPRAGAGLDARPHVRRHRGGAVGRRRSRRRTRPRSTRCSRRWPADAVPARP